MVGHRRVPGLKLKDDRVILLLDGLLHPGDFVVAWKTSKVYARLLTRHRLTAAAYYLSQVRSDPGELRVQGR